MGGAVAATVARVEGAADGRDGDVEVTVVVEIRELDVGGLVAEREGIEPDEAELAGRRLAVAALGRRRGGARVTRG